MPELSDQQAFVEVWKAGKFREYAKDAVAVMDVPEPAKINFAWKIGDLAGRGRVDVGEFWATLTDDELKMINATVDLAAVAMEQEATVALGRAKAIKRPARQAEPMEAAEPEEPPTFGGGPGAE